jgi:hypothetical protein
MKKFLFNVLLFFLFFLSIVIGGLLIIRITNPKDMYFSLIDKHQMLEKTKSPRIILVGGSNLSFGINSKMIEESLHVKVINTSVHAGLGLKYITDDIIRFIKKGDIVILAPEYEHFFGNTLYGSEPMVNSVISVPETYKFFNFQNWKEILGALPKTAVKNIIKLGLTKYDQFLGIKKVGVYDRNSFNEYGDVNAHYQMENEDFDAPKGIKGSFNFEAIKTVVSFKKSIKDKGGMFLFTYPCLMNTSLNSITKEVDTVNFKLIEAGVQIIGTPQRYSLNDSLYFNSQYHLDKDGVEIRTTHLIEDLQESGNCKNFLETITKE